MITILNEKAFIDEVVDGIVEYDGPKSTTKKKKRLTNADNLRKKLEEEREKLLDIERRRYAMQIRERMALQKEENESRFQTFYRNMMKLMELFN
ncbi:MAG: hypothetical protein EZS28_050587, partial [Streblomastix strix]